MFAGALQSLTGQSVRGTAAVESAYGWYDTVTSTSSSPTATRRHPLPTLDDVDANQR